jgi:hypothetical protein
MNDYFRYSERLLLVQAYSDWIKKCYDQGWEGYLFSFMFNHISGSRDARVNEMQKDLYRWYGRLLTRMYRNPRSSNSIELLPKAVLFPDSPVPKHDKQPLRDVTVNEGLHCHGVLMAHDWGRLGCSLHLHTQRKQGVYLTDKLRRIDVQPITHAPEYVTEYAIKALKRPGSSLDHVMILPRSKKELPAG